jgi:hypothetical protein
MKRNGRNRLEITKKYMLYMAGTTLKLITTVINKEGLVYALGVKYCLQRLKPRA